MLDDSPRQEPFRPSPDDADPWRDQPTSPPAAAPIEPAAPTPLQGVGTTPAPAGAAAASTTSLIAADISDAWARLEPSARLLVGASIAAIVIVVIGLPLSVWDSAPMALLVMTAGVITAVTGWFGESTAFRGLPIPRSTIELVATSVVIVLAVLKAVEIVFGLDTAGFIALIVGAALVAAAIAQMIAARRRGADPLAVTRGDQGTRIAAVGLLLVLVGWLFNLSISFWTMGQAALPLAVLTIAALTVVEAPRIDSPIPVAWVGAGIAIFGAILALAHWGDLTSLGRTEIELEPLDFLGLLVYTVGAALIIAGAVLSGRATWTSATTPNAPIDGQSGPV